jgi:NTE family protein
MAFKKLLKVGLALSGGGAKGFAHIGVIKELEKLGLSFHCLAGTSMGALIGAWYVAGKDFSILEEIARSKKWRDFLPLREVFHSVKSGGGLFSLNSFEKFLENNLSNLKLEDLKTPFTAVATSLKTGKKVEINSGSLSQAILASSCIPVIFAPVEKNGDLLVDGGIVDNFPVDSCFKMGAEIVIGIDVRHLPSYFHEEIREQKRSYYFLQWKIFQVLNYLMEIVLPELEVRESGKLIIIKPYVSHISTFDFGRVDEIEKLGQEAFEKKEDELREKRIVPKGKDFLGKTV